MVHTDRGYQYTSRSFKQFVENKKLEQSMSRAGKCIDNGPMEIFLGMIKVEMYYRKHYKTFEDLETDSKRYNMFYNTERVTLIIGLQIPA